MPTYEYRCRDCGHSFDIVQKMSDDPLTHCPECGGPLSKGKTPAGTDNKEGSTDTKKSDNAKSKGSSSSGRSSSSDSDSSSSGSSTSERSSSSSTKEEGSS